MTSPSFEVEDFDDLWTESCQKTGENKIVPQELQPDVIIAGVVRFFFWSLKHRNTEEIPIDFRGKDFFRGVVTKSEAHHWCLNGN